MSPQISIATSSSFSSAPTSPRRSFSKPDTKNVCFYSVPTSPKAKLDDTRDLGCKTTSPASTTMTDDCEISNVNDDYFDVNDFEFETSRHFSVMDEDVYNDSESDSDSSVDVEFHYQEPRKRQRKRHGSLPAMAFADELFCDGKVMPLNPPPCQQYSNCNENKNSKDCPSQSPNSASFSPMNPSSIFKLPFPRRNLWNDDFDPFMVALKNVKEGKKHRRALSMLPLRACTQWDPEEFIHENCLHSSPIIQSPIRQMEPNGSPVLLSQQTMNYGSKSPVRLAEPKGVLFARRARMVKMDYKGPRPIVVPVADPMVEENGGLNERPSTTPGGGSKRWHKIMSFAHKNASMTKTTGNEQKERGANAEFSRPKILRKLSLRSKKLVHGNEEKQASQMTKMTLVRYRPKLLLCMGYGNFQK
ncbi:hypothetical protein JCGZ_22733 [Jatropha curcas]|uniref:Uncharacterized protein n=1 Tax=Jatropha curcas TaxID=180498 RepID=A0A067L3Z1_JATCU|nr:hypothetical protein JCGZ_22733 [Jatropha curcas]